MAKTRFLLLPAIGYVLGGCFTIVLIISITPPTLGQGAAQLLKEGSRYQGADDTSDRAADLYRQLIREYPKSAQAESAQFFLGTYFEKKFFIIEQRSKSLDWDSLNKADEELYAYVGRYPKGSYLADAYHALAIVALRRGYGDTASKLYEKMKGVAANDQRVYIFRFTWSPNSSDLIKGYCDTASLASASLEATRQQSSFDGVVRVLTDWARGHCR